MRDKWMQMSMRERVIASFGVIFLVSFVVYSLVLTPMVTHKQSLKRDVENKQELFSWMRENSTRLIQFRGSSKSKVDSKKTSLLTRVESSLREKGMGQFHPGLSMKDSKTATLSFDTVDFDSLIVWIDAMQFRYGIEVEQASFQATAKPGIVKASLILSN